MKEIGLFLLLWLLKGCYCSFKNGKKLTNAFATLKGPFGMKQCIKECLLQKRCQSLGYNRKQLQCELGDSEDVVDVSDQEFVTAFRSELSDYQRLLGNCANHSCDLLQRCVARNSGKYQCVIPASCNSAGYTIIHSGKDCACQKIYFFGVWSVSYTMATNQCRADGGRLMILDKMWKINKMADNLEAGGATSENCFIVNGSRNENGSWNYSDGREFVQHKNLKYTLNNDKTFVVMTRDRKFSTFSREQLVYGFVCEM